MQIGEVIRRRRKELGLTQEQMAARLGVTAPAVNKWERGVTLPDIALLAPIARLLGITTDTLLSFRAEPAPEQIDALAARADALLAERPYAEVFAWVREQLRRWPDSVALRLRLGQLMDARRAAPPVPEAERYDAELVSWIRPALESADPHIVTEAAHWLFALSLRRENYAEAEEYLSYLPEDDPQRKRMQADIYAGTGRTEEAYKALEELLFSENNTLTAILTSLYMLALGQNDRGRARYYEEKRGALARVFEMGAYHECAGLELAVMDRDADAVLSRLEIMLRDTESIFGFTASPLYAHMDFRETDRERFIPELRRDLLANFREMDFLRDDPRFQALAAEFADAGAV